MPRRRLLGTRRFGAERMLLLLGVLLRPLRLGLLPGVLPVVKLFLDQVALPAVRSMGSLSCLAFDSGVIFFPCGQGSSTDSP